MCDIVSGSRLLTHASKNIVCIILLFICCSAVVFLLFKSLPASSRCSSFACSSAHVVSCCGAAVRRLFVVLIVQVLACFISLSFVRLLFCSCGVALRRWCASLIRCPYCSNLCLLHLAVLHSLALLPMLCCAAPRFRCAHYTYTCTYTYDVLRAPEDNIHNSAIGLSALWWASGFLEITTRYRPASVALAAALSCAALCCCAALLCAAVCCTHAHPHWACMRAFE